MLLEYGTENVYQKNYYICVMKNQWNIIFSTKILVSYHHSV
jgi:hypothetical protein